MTVGDSNAFVGVPGLGSVNGLDIAAVLVDQKNGLRVSSDGGVI